MADDSNSMGAPLIVGSDPAEFHALERVPLTPEGKGAFSEAWLQELIHRHPGCLPISGLEPGLGQFHAVCREIPTSRGYIDNLLMTGAGDIAIIEAKLFRNPQARREALAQALDYATCLFGMNYDGFERAVLGGQFAPHPKPVTLHDALPNDHRLEQAAFIDAVSSNLRRGRALILVVGDGIRSETEELMAGLQTHARFGFTLAVIELAVFHIPGEPGRFLVRPSTLAKTEIVHRIIVEVTGTGPAVREEKLAAPQTLSSEDYWKALETKQPGTRAILERLLAAVEPLGVYPEFLGSLNLKWQRPDAKPVNLGYILKYGALWTDITFSFAPHDLAEAYVRELATIFDCDLYTFESGDLTPYKHGKPLKVAEIGAAIDKWPDAMARFIDAIRRRDAQEASVN